MGKVLLLHLPLKSCYKETSRIKGIVFRILHLMVTRASARSCHVTAIIVDAAQSTILRVFHEMIHLVYTISFIISYYEATKTQRD